MQKGPASGGRALLRVTELPHRNWELIAGPAVLPGIRFI
jgi:hypothetical protein